ncbi:MsnO8 family LLM class oxidoreductase [Serratia ureilytica]
MTENTAVPLSVLDLSPIPRKARDAFHCSLDLAQHAERWGYRRYWLAEHHNMTGIGSAASVLLGYLAAGTQSIRLGSGGVMLPNHAPLVIAEQFGTLESLYPGRIDLGLGRAPGTDQRTMMALRRHLSGDVDTFPRDVQELQNYFCDAQPGQPVQAVPGGAARAALAARLQPLQRAAGGAAWPAVRLRLALRPGYAVPALQLYRENFKPSKQLAQPHAMVCVNVIAADSDSDARFLFSSMQQQFINLRRGSPGPLPPPVDNIHALWTAGEQYGVEQALRMSIVGDEKPCATGCKRCCVKPMPTRSWSTARSSIIRRGCVRSRLSPGERRRSEG